MNVCQSVGDLNPIRTIDRNALIWTKTYLTAYFIVVQTVEHNLPHDVLACELPTIENVVLL